MSEAQCDGGTSNERVNPSGLSSARTKKRSVRFEDGDKLVTAVFQPAGPWENADRLNPYELVGAYKIRCDNDGVQPLYSVFSQLQDIDLKLSYARRPHFTLKGTQLNAAHVEILEEVFKRVQFEHLNLENTNLDDESLVALCEMLEFYESCTELCLSRNTRIHSVGWKALARLVRKLPSLKWLDLRGAKLTDSDVILLAHAIRSQAVSCRADVSRYMKFRLANRRLLAKRKESAKAGGRVTTDSDEERAATCAQHGTIGCAQCLSQLPYVGLRGLHLGSAGIRQLTWDSLINALRLSSVCDVRLPDNQLGPQEALMLTPLIRYGASLRYLDLSRNHLGPDGCAYIASALASPAFPNKAAKSSGLRRLDLSENELDAPSMNKLSVALPHCRNLTCLQLSGNKKIGCTGVVNLQSGLLTCRRLTHLGLAACRIECVGAVALAELLVDKPRRLSVINLRWNKVGAAGLLALARCLQCVHRRIQIDGLDQSDVDSSLSYTPDRILQTAAKLAGGPSDVPKAVDPFLGEAWVTLKRLQDENLRTFPKTSTTSPRYCDIICPTSHSVFGGPRSPTNEIPEDLDPRYMWGDSSEDENEEQDDDLTAFTESETSNVYSYLNCRPPQTINNSPVDGQLSSPPRSRVNGDLVKSQSVELTNEAVPFEVPSDPPQRPTSTAEEKLWTDPAFQGLLNGVGVEVGSFFPVPLH
ncbi:Protein phosphatase 1 regulatory subunit 37 [Clonorchis sinensis]|uniref:Protein phosphatase 1 regulatory subunit 37 n=1 Tax=Clonorchis sinensis TaxID=79923 RepID=A0A419PQE3_CLOSI|nr:Protein phosphatase 1 regulatory subunit 37 [Clonorchis sinensis]